MKKLFTILFLLSIIWQSQRANATAWYVHSRDGGTNAGTLANPWKTLADINWASVSAGDSILLHGGDVFTEKLIIGASGSVGNAIYIGRYSTGFDPIISAGVGGAITSWTNIGTNLWESTSAIKSSTTMLNMVNKNSALIPKGRLPKTGYWTVDSHSGNSSITSSSLSGQPSFAGGEIVNRKNHWIIDVDGITSNSGTTLNLSTDSDPAYTIQTGWGFFVQNDVDACTQQDDWYYNTSTRKLTMYSVGTPNSIIVGAIDTLVTVDNESYITFKHLNFFGANKFIIYLNMARNISIDSCLINYSGYNGIHCTNAGGDAIVTRYVTITNSTIQYINNNGIEGYGCKYMTIDNCNINYIANAPGMGGNSDEMYFGVHRIGDFSQFTNNVIDSIGYTALHFRGTNITVSNNYIHDYCFVKDDGAGIYTYATDNLGTVISNNVVGKGIGAPDGTSGATYAEGIYMDDETANVTISGNTVFDVSHSGIYIHNAHEITIRDNVVYNAGYRQLDFTHDDLAPSDPIRNVTLKKNIFFAKESGQYAWRFQTNAADALSFGTADSNYYCRPVNEVTDVLRIDGVDYTLSSWQSYSSQDAHSNGSPKTVSSTDSLLFVYNPTDHDSVITLPYKYVDVFNNAYDGSITLSEYSGKPLIYVAAKTPPPPSDNYFKFKRGQLKFGGGTAYHEPIGVDFDFAFRKLILKPYSSKVLIYKSKPDAVVLPVSLMNFKTSVSGNVVNVSWSTASESNCERFDIEVSEDGINWKTIKSIPTKAVNGNSSSKLDYSTQIILK